MDTRSIHVDGGVSLSSPIHYPSSHRLHKWGSATLGGLTAPRPFTQGVNDGRHTQRTISLASPLNSKPDQIISATKYHAKAAPTASVLKHLTGAGEDSPRLRPFDRTRHQPAQDTTRGSSYNLDYCRPAAMRTSRLPPLEKRLSPEPGEAAAERWLGDGSRTSREISRAARGLLNDTDDDLPMAAMSASLDPAYNASRHGVRSIIPPRGHVFAR